MKLLEVVKKNLLRILRSRTSAIVIVLGPFIMILLLGFAYNNLGVKGISIGMSGDKGEIGEDITKALQEKGFSVMEYESESSCVQGVKNALNHLCIFFYQKDRPTVRYYVDYSNVNLVYVLVDFLTKNAKEHSAEISTEIVQGILSGMNSTAEDLSSGKSDILRLKEDMESLQSKFELLRSGMENADDISLLPNVTNVQEQVNSYILYLEDSRENFNKDAGRFRESIAEQKKDIQNYRQRIERSQKQSEVLRESILSTASPCFEEDGNSTVEHCDAVIDSVSRIDETIQELEDINEKLMETEEDIDKAEREYDLFMDSTDETFDVSIAKLKEQNRTLTEFSFEISMAKTEFNQTKSNLIENLDGIESQFSEGSSKYDKLNESFSGIGDSLKNYTSYSADMIVRPVNIEVKPVMAKQKTLFYLFPSLITLVLTFIGILLASTIEIKERTAKAFSRSLITPASRAVSLAGTYLTCLLVVSLQTLIIMGLAQIFFQINLFRSPVTMLILAAGILLFSSLGIILGNILKNEETVTISAVIVAIILLVFSNSMVPVENMSKAAAGIARLSPFYLVETLFKRTIILGAPPESLYGVAAVLCLELMIFALLSVYFFRRARQGF